MSSFSLSRNPSRNNGMIHYLIYYLIYYLIHFFIIIFICFDYLVLFSSSIFFQFMLQLNRNF